MARLATVGFETGGLETNSYATVLLTTVTAAQARTGSYSLRLVTNLGRWLYNLGSDISELFGRIAVRIPANSITTDMAWSFLNSDGQPVGYLIFDGGTQTFGFSVNGSVVLARGNTVISGDRWYVLEFRFKLNASGVFALKVDAVTDFSYSGSITGSVRTVALQGPTSLGDVSVYVDDIAFNDTTGSFENTYPGLGGIFFLKANGDGHATEFTPSAGSDHYALVDDVPANTTDWVQALDADKQELFAIENTPEYVTQINVVQPVFQAAVAVSGSNELRDLVYDGSADYPGDTTQTVVSIAPDYVFYRGKVYYEQPDGTSGAFDAAALDALQMGFEIPA